MALEEKVETDASLTPSERERVMREIQTWFERDAFGDEGDLDEGSLASWVLKPGPRSPHGQAGETAQPEESFLEYWEDTKRNSPVFPSRKAGRLGRAHVWRIVRAAALRAVLTGNVSPHWFRHAHDSRMQHKCRSVESFMGPVWVDKSR
ncbi:MAG: integrase/recombinase XerD [Bryobacterales bacterium]|nr:integrase/recombinase XerD [Bryobacterales bacterium]